MRSHFILLLLGLGGLVGAASAQTTSTTQFGFGVGSVAKVVQGTDTLRYAWAGGLNTPQFSSIDLNGDGQPDLYAFDRETTRSYTFLNVADTKATKGRSYQYAPEYEYLFPTDLESWVQLRDYDCDGRADLFTYAKGGDVRVFHNVADANGRPSFVLASNQLLFAYGTYMVNVNTGFYNVPSIQDVNGDGRLDVVTYDFIGSSYIELYLNTSTGSCGGISSFDYTTNYWGQITACPTACGAFQTNGAAACQVYKVTHSAGHNILLIDLNGDGKLDELEGRDNCPQLTRMLNTGASSVVATVTSPNITSAFPSAAAPISLPVCPAPASLDVTFDGVPDLLVTPAMVNNTSDFVSMRHNILLYQNAATTATAVPSFSLATNSFLQSDMLDVSEGATPTFGDIDGDGLTDMLVGNQGDLVNGLYRASIYYYRNVGTALKPVFRLVTDDYMGLAATAALTPGNRFQSVLPRLVDLNRDGALDLAYSAYMFYAPDTAYPNGHGVNYLYYVLNTATVGQPVVFNMATASYFKPQGAVGTGVLTSAQYDAPCFFDVDGDGYVDMLLGTNDNTESALNAKGLRYFRNQGAGTKGGLDYAFVLVNNDYGTLRTTNPNAYNSRPTNISPLVADFDKDGNPDLLTIDGFGDVNIYPNFRSQQASFTGQSNLFYNSLTQQSSPSRLGGGSIGAGLLRFTPAVADLNQDGKLELYLGTETGGIISYLNRTSAALASRSAASQALGLGLYPNPATAAATVETAQATRLRVFDLTGRLVQHEEALLRTRTLNLQGLAPGVYLVQATAADGTSATQRLAVQ
ncbi:MAG: T9SS type A sorting domain-containing protein [Janthinobacterium lividum]